MSRKLALFNAVKAAVVADGYFRTFDLFNNQYEFEAEGQINSFLFPGLFMEFGTIEHESQARGASKGKASVTFHIGVRWMDRNPAAIFTAIDRLAGILDLLSGQDYLFVKGTETQVTGFSKVALWQVNYSLIYLEDNGQKELTKIEGAELDLTLITGRPDNPTEPIPPFVPSYRYAQVLAKAEGEDLILPSEEIQKIDDEAVRALEEIDFFSDLEAFFLLYSNIPGSGDFTLINLCDPNHMATKISGPIWNGTNWQATTTGRLGTGITDADGPARLFSQARGGSFLFHYQAQPTLTSDALQGNDGVTLQTQHWPLLTNGAVLRPYYRIFGRYASPATGGLYPLGSDRFDIVEWIPDIATNQTSNGTIIGSTENLAGGASTGSEIWILGYQTIPMRGVAYHWGVGRPLSLEKKGAAERILKTRLNKIKALNP